MCRTPLNGLQPCQKNACYRLPWLNSGCDALVGRKIGGGFDIDAAHVSQSGIVTQHAGTSGRVRMSPITPVEAVRAFLQGKDIEYLKTSAPGLALERIIEMLKGLVDAILPSGSLSASKSHLIQ